MAETSGEWMILEEFGGAEVEDDVFEYPRHQFHGIKTVDFGTDTAGADDDDLESFLHVTVTGTHPAPTKKVFVQMPSSRGGDDSVTQFLELSKTYDLKDMAEEQINLPLMRSFRGVYRLFPIDALFIVEISPERIPFVKSLGRQEFYFEVLSQGNHIVYYATAVRSRPFWSIAPRVFKINLFDFDGAHVCLFDMERTFCRFDIRVHSPAVKFGSIRYTGCTMKSPSFKIRNKHFRTDFIAYPMKKTKSCSIPHEYLVMGTTADAKVAHIGRNWAEDDYPIVVKRSLNMRRKMYGVVFEEPLRMFQKLNILALAFAVKFIRQDFDRPPPPPPLPADSKTFSASSTG